MTDTQEQERVEDEYAEIPGREDFQRWTEEYLHFSGKGISDYYPDMGSYLHDQLVRWRHGRRLRDSQREGEREPGDLDPPTRADGSPCSPAELCEMLRNQDWGPTIRLAAQQEILRRLRARQREEKVRFTAIQVLSMLAGIGMIVLGGWLFGPLGHAVADVVILWVMGSTVAFLWVSQPEGER